MKLSFCWYGQDSIVLHSKNGSTVFVDPFNLPAVYTAKVDAVFITHPHFDHLSIENIVKVAAAETPIYVPYNAVDKLKAEGFRNIKRLKPGHSFTFSGISVDVFPAYNIVKKKYHPKKSQWLGYVFTIDGQRIYVPGDTERIPEMKEVEADIAFMPLGQTYTMNSVDEAVEAVLDTKAKVAIPIHYGMFEGTFGDALSFRKKLTPHGVEVFMHQKAYSI